MSENILCNSLNKKRILITGVSGLIGRILFNYLINLSTNQYEIFGLDRHLNISSRYKLNSQDQIEKNYPIFKENFLQCDITDRIQFYQIIEKYQFDIIIHLAAILETHPDLQYISHVNIEGTKNVFNAPGVQRIIYASSVRTIFGYLNQQPYCSILTNQFNSDNIVKITADDYPPLPMNETPGDKIYCQTKIFGEQMAEEIVKTTTKSIISIRFGWVNTFDQAGDTWYRTIWLSYRDLCSFIHKTIEASNSINGIYFAISNNHQLWIDLDKSKRDLGYIPLDGAKII